MNVSEYNTIVKEYSNRVCRFVDKMLMDKEAAKDITQEAFLKLWENKDTIDPAKARAWLFTTAYRLTMDHLSRIKKYAYNKSFPHPEIESDPPDLKSLIEAMVKELPTIQKSVLLLRDYEGYSYEEIAEILQLNISQVKVYLFRARHKIKSYIKDLRHVL